MSKHTYSTRGQVFIWDEDIKDISQEGVLLNLWGTIGNLYSYSTYIGEDPEREWNRHVSELQIMIIDWIIELREKKEQKLAIDHDTAIQN